MDDQTTTQPVLPVLPCPNIACRKPMATIAENGAALQLAGGAGVIRQMVTIWCSEPDCGASRVWRPARPAKKAA